MADTNTYQFTLSSFAAAVRSKPDDELLDAVLKLEPSYKNYIDPATLRTSTTKLDDGEERRFQMWYGLVAKRTGLDPDPDAAEHHYDYRGAYKAGARPVKAEDGAYHWPSTFKSADHPNRYVDGVDTITGKPEGAYKFTRDSFLQQIRSTPDEQLVAGVLKKAPQYRKLVDPTTLPEDLLPKPAAVPMSAAVKPARMGLMDRARSIGGKAAGVGKAGMEEFLKQRVKQGKRVRLEGAKVKDSVDHWLRERKAKKFLKDLREDWEEAPPVLDEPSIGRTLEQEIRNMIPEEQARILAERDEARVHGAVMEDIAAQGPWKKALMNTQFASVPTVAAALLKMDPARAGMKESVRDDILGGRKLWKDAQSMGLLTADTPAGRFFQNTLPSVLPDMPAFIAMHGAHPSITLGGLNLARQGSEMVLGEREKLDTKDALRAGLLGVILRPGPVLAPIMNKLPAGVQATLKDTASKLNAPTGGPVTSVGKHVAGLGVKAGAAQLIDPLTGEEMGMEKFGQTWALFVAMDIVPLVRKGARGHLNKRLQQHGLTARDAAEVADNLIYNQGRNASTASVVKAIKGNKGDWIQKIAEEYRKRYYALARPGDVAKPPAPKVPVGQLPPGSARDALFSAMQKPAADPRPAARKMIEAAKALPPAAEGVIEAAEKPAPAPVPAAEGEWTPEYKPGSSVMAPKKPSLKKLHKAKVVQQIDKDTVRVMLRGEKFTRDIPVGSVQRSASVTARRKQHEEIAHLPKEKRREIRADAKEFDRIVEASAFFDVDRADAPATGERQRAMNRSAAMNDARTRVFEALGYPDADTKSVKTKAELLPKLKEWIQGEGGKAMAIEEVEMAKFAERRYGQTFPVPEMELGDGDLVWHDGSWFEVKAGKTDAAAKTLVDGRDIDLDEWESIDVGVVVTPTDPAYEYAAAEYEAQERAEAEEAADVDVRKGAEGYRAAYRAIVGSDADVRLDPSAFGLSKEQATEIEMAVEAEGDSDLEPDVEGPDIEGAGQDAFEDASLQELLATDYAEILKVRGGGTASGGRAEADVLTTMRANIEMLTGKKATDAQALEAAEDAYNRQQEIRARHKAAGVSTPVETSTTPVEKAEPGPSEKWALTAQFMNKDDEWWGVTFDDDGVSTFAESGYGGTQCTGFACAIAKKLPGRAKVYGFSAEDNPRAAVGEIADGHDFAVVDDRYIVDPWLVEVESGRITSHNGQVVDVKGQGVFDMEDPADAELVEQVYGPRHLWRRMREVEPQEPDSVQAAGVSTPVETSTTPVEKAEPYTFKEHVGFVRRLRQGQVKADELRATFDRFMENADGIKAELNKKTIADLKMITPFARGKKADVVRLAFARLQDSFWLGESFMWQPTAETKENALRRHLSEYTDEDLRADAARRMGVPTGKEAEKPAPVPDAPAESGSTAAEKVIKAARTPARAPAVDPGEVKVAVPGATHEPGAAPTTLRKAGLKVTQVPAGVSKKGKPYKGYWLVTGNTFEHKDLLGKKGLGGSWNRWEKGYKFYKGDPSNELTQLLEGGEVDVERDALTKARVKRGGPVQEGHGEPGSGGESDAELARLKGIREREDGRPDESGIAGDLERYVGPDTRDLIRSGAAFGIPDTVLNEQVEDVALINRAYQSEKPVFILSSAPGSGKTFVLGGAMRELKAAGADRILYVTMRQPLIDQIKRDLAKYDIGPDVDFVTYAGVRKGYSGPPPDVVIFDEAHSVKNVNSLQGKVGKQLMGGARFTVIASATPFENPVQAQYLEPTGLFAPAGDFVTWAKAYGAAVIKKKVYDPTTGRRYVEEIPVWRGGKAEDGIAARRWFFKQGVMTYRPMRIPVEMADVRFRKTVVGQEWVDLYENVTDTFEALEGEWKDPDTGKPIDSLLFSQIAMYKTNLQKRILESAKIPETIKRAQEHLDAGRSVVVFVETKAARDLGTFTESGAKPGSTRYTYPQMQEMMDEYLAELAMARQQGERLNRKPPFGEAMLQIARAMHNAGLVGETLPSTTDALVEAFGADDVAIYTGAVSEAEGERNLADWRSKKKRVLAATMAKGGTGLSIHDTEGDRPTAQVNNNLPWVATGVDQVAGRTLRYGIQSKAYQDWIFCDNIPFDKQLAARVGGRMRDMGGIVKGMDLESAQLLQSFDFEDDASAREAARGETREDIEGTEETVDELYEQAWRLERGEGKADDTSGGFFQTPYPLSLAMTRIAEVGNGSVLEPSAGRGKMLHWLPAGARVTAIEQRPDNFAVLKNRQPGATLVNDDFLEWAEGDRGPFDVVLMNPPFERVKGIGAQDVAHVRRAYDMLSPDGRLVAVMGEGAFFRGQKQEAEFRDWLEDVGAQVVTLPQDTFKTSGTGVRTRLVVIDRNGEAGRYDLELNGLENIQELEEMVAPRPGTVEAARTDRMMVREAAAWHGSPHGFDEFDTAAIGTGEGAQAFGWGLYFTELEQVARHYAGMGARDAKMLEVDGELMSEKYPDIFWKVVPGNEGAWIDIAHGSAARGRWMVNLLDKWAEEKRGKHLTAAKMAADLRDMAPKIEWREKGTAWNLTHHRAETYYEGKWPEGGRVLSERFRKWRDRDGKDAFRIAGMPDELEATTLEEAQAEVLAQSIGAWDRRAAEAGREAEQYRGLAEDVKEGRLKARKSRNLYQVTLHKGRKPGEYRWLDWDKEVPDEFLEEIAQTDDFRGMNVKDRVLHSSAWAMTSKVRGQNLYHWLERELGRPEDASMFLLDNGIDGIRYPVGTLTGQRHPTAKNYVVFDKDAVTVEEHVVYERQKNLYQAKARQEDMFDYSETGFRLEAERGVDGERIQRERDAADARAAERERQQTDLFADSGDLIREQADLFNAKARQFDLDLGAIEGYVRVQKAPKELLNGISRAVSRAADLRMAGPYSEGTEQLRFDPGAGALGPPETPAPQADTPRYPPTHSVKDVATPEGAREAFAESDVVSAVISDLVNQRIDRIDFAGKRITGPADLAMMMIPLRTPYQETFKVALTNDRGGVVWAGVITAGLLDESLVHAREVLAPVIRAQGSTGARNVWLSHNHPSADPSPSAEDLNVTKKLTKAIELMGFRLKDHVITDGKKFYSTAEGRMIDLPDGVQAAWEREPLEDLPRARSPEDIQRVAEVLRQGSPDVGHIIYLNAKFAIMGIERFPVAEGREALARRMARGSVREAAAAVVMDYPVSRPEAAEMVRALAATQGVLDIKLLDAMYSDYNSLRRESPNMFVEEARAEYMVREGEPAYEPERKPDEIIIGLPEMVRITRALLDNKIPKTRKSIPRALGFFRHGEGPGSRGEIHLRKSLFDIPYKRKRELMAEADEVAAREKSDYLAVLKRLFKEEYAKPENQAQWRAAAVLSHELGHVVDWLPDKFTGRGNILGRIKSAKGAFLGTTLQKMPGSAEDAIAPEERKRLRAAIQKEVRAAMGKKPDKDALNKRVKELYQKRVKEMIEERGLVTRDEINAELRALADWWNPQFGGGAPHTASEIYADAWSVLMNRPAELRVRAPKFWTTFHNWLGEGKPAVTRLWAEIQAGIKAAANNRQMAADLRAGFNRADTERASVLDATKLTGAMVVDGLKAAFIDKHAVILDRVRKVGEKDLPAMKNPRFAIEELLYCGDIDELYVKDVNARMLEPLQAAGLDWDDLGELLFHRRVLSERFAMANPLGVTPERAKQRLAEMQETLGPEKWGVLEQVRAAFWALRNEHVIPLIDESAVHTADVRAKIRNNEEYATFNVVDYLAKQYGAGVGAGIHRQMGTLKEIENPATAMLLKDLSLVHSIHRHLAKREIAEFMIEHFPKEIEAAKTRWTGRHHEPVPTTDPTKGMLVYLQDGKVKAYYVPKMMALSWENQPEGYIRMVGYALAKLTGAQFFREVFTELNYGFWMFNIVRDFVKLYRGVPGMSFVKTFGAYKKGIRPAWQSVFGMSDAVGRQMLKEKMLIPLANPRGIRDDDLTLERELAKYNLMPRKQRNAALKPFYKLAALLHVWSDIGRAFERVPKFAGYKFLKAQYPELDDRDLAHIVRVQAGSPSFLRKGLFYPIYNNLYLFSNAMKEGWRSEGELLKSSPSEWWRKMFITAWLPKLWQWGWRTGLVGGGITLAVKLIKGEDDDDEEEGVSVQRLYQNISEYDLRNYHCAALGLTKTGKTVYLRMPMDENSRVMGGILWNLLPRPDGKGGWEMEGGQAGSAMGTLFDYASGQAPNLVPLIKIAQMWGEYARGRNPHDAFRGRGVLDETVAEARGVEALAGLARRTANDLGTGIIYRFDTDDPAAIKTQLEEILGLPVVNNILGRFVKVSDYGVKEAVRSDWAEIRKEQARETLDRRNGTMKFALGNTDEITTDELIAIAKKPDLLANNVQKILSGRHGGVWMQMFNSARSMEERLAVLQKMVEYEKQGR